jgi:N-acetylglucosamine malate deacetylase 1
MKPILIIAAHPDDEVLGCGGVIARESARGVPCHVLILTDGSGGRYDDDMVGVLKANALAANRILGSAGVIQEDLPNQALDTLPITRIAQCIEGHLETLKPEKVYTHHAGDLNRDHRLVHEASMVACRPYPGQGVRGIYSYCTPSSTEYNFIEGEHVFIPNLFVDIRGTIDKKIAALQAYKTECRDYPHPRSPDALRTCAVYWGLTVGLEYAEPFKLIRGVR